MKVKKLVVDSSALIQNIKIEEYGDEIYTIREVVSEVRDKATRVRLQTVPYQFIFREPTQECYKIVKEASLKIGDYNNLSVVDLRILALTVQMAKEAGMEPRPLDDVSEPAVTTGGTAGQSEEKTLPGWGGTWDSESSDSEEEDDPQPTPDADATVQDPSESDTESSDEDEGWITPGNIKQIRNLNLTEEQIQEDETGELAAACATCDFSMQNVLLKLGIPVIARDGMRVREVRSWALRCASCTTIDHDMSKVFCRSCGHRNLKRVPYTVNAATGKKEYFLSKKKNPKCLNLRGTVYNVKAPKGGKHCTDVIVCEGQRVHYDKLSKKAMKRQNMLNGEIADADNPFSMHDVSSRGFHKGNHRSKRYGVAGDEMTAQQLRTGAGFGNNKKHNKGRKRR